MQTKTIFSHRWRGALHLALIVLLLALGAPTVTPGASAAIAPTAASGASVELAPLLQFTAGGHVIGFAPTQVILASFDHALRIQFVGTAGVTPVAASADVPSSSNGRTMGASPLGVVTYPELWRSISVEYRASEDGIVKSTYTLAPGADAGQIRLRYNVPVQVQSDGSLQFHFGRGVISESAPIAWQEIDGVRVNVPVAFRVFEATDANLQSEIGFRLGAYDPRYPLVIDPNYVWHTFYGSSLDDEGHAIAVDESGNVYIAGTSEFAWQGDGGANPLHAHSGGWDIVVVKLNSAGAYQWHTFYGSAHGYSDVGSNIAVDGSGNVYVVGSSYATWQGDGGANPLHAYSGSDDIVVLKLNSAGAYQWHTFYGSASNDRGYGIAIDKSGNVYILGYSYATWQGDGGANPLHAYSGGFEIVVLKLNSAGAYQWHTFYGSLSLDFGIGIAVDAGGNVYITGQSFDTWRGDNNTNPLHAHSGGGDIVVVKLNSAGAYQWHTFYGSSSHDSGGSIVVDGSGNVYIAGKSGATWQGDGGANPLHAYSGGVDIVVLKLNSAGAYQWHTFYGSSGNDYNAGIAIDGSINIYITGQSNSTWQGDGGANPLHAHSGGWDIVALKLGAPTQYRLYLPLVLKGN